MDRAIQQYTGSALQTAELSVASATGSEQPNAGEYMTLAQAAVAFGLSERTIRKRIRKGQILAEKVVTSRGWELRIPVGGHRKMVQNDSEWFGRDSECVRNDGSERFGATTEGVRNSQQQVEAPTIANLEARFARIEGTLAGQWATELLERLRMAPTKEEVAQTIEEALGPIVKRLEAQPQPLTSGDIRQAVSTAVQPLMDRLDTLAAQNTAMAEVLNAAVKDALRPVLRELDVLAAQNAGLMATLTNPPRWWEFWRR